MKSTLQSQKNELQKFKINKFNIPLEDKVQIIMKITQMLLSNLSKSHTGMPKTDSVMMKKIKSSIRMYKNSNEAKPKYEKFLDNNKSNQAK